MILALLMGWQFTAAEFVGGPIMIVLVAVLFRLFVRSRTIEAARAQAERDRRVDGRPRGDGYGGAFNAIVRANGSRSGSPSLSTSGTALAALNRHTRFCDKLPRVAPPQSTAQRL